MAKAKRVSGRRSKGEYLYALGPIAAAQVRLRRAIARAAKMAARLKSYGLPRGAARAVGHVQNMVWEGQQADEALDKVPNGWKPARGTLGATPIEEWATVMVKEAFADRYIDLFDVKKPLTVVNISGGRLVCETKFEGNSVRVKVPRSHVQPEEN